MKSRPKANISKSLMAKMCWSKLSFIKVREEGVILVNSSRNFWERGIEQLRSLEGYIEDLIWSNEMAKKDG
jgi:hypothetical protein